MVSFEKASNVIIKLVSFSLYFGKRGPWVTITRFNLLALRNICQKVHLR